MQDALELKEKEDKELNELRLTYLYGYNNPATDILFGPAEEVLKELRTKENPESYVLVIPDPDVFYEEYYEV